jgi:hypothetical protein
VPAVGVRNRSHRQVALWAVSTLALLAILVGVIQVTLRFLPGADAAAGAIAASVVTPTVKPTTIATLPPINSPALHSVSANNAMLQRCWN